MKLLKKVWELFLQPQYIPVNYPKPLRNKILVNLLLLKISVALILGLSTTIFIELFQLETGEHSAGKMLVSQNPVKFFLYGIIFAPFIEEIIFRGPLVFFKNSELFPIVFYLMILLFGLIHIFNYETYEKVIWFAPILVLPQLAGGVFLSFVRIKMGLWYSILIHALFNSVLLGPFILLTLLKTLLD